MARRITFRLIVSFFVIALSANYSLASDNLSFTGKWEGAAFCDNSVQTISMELFERKNVIRGFVRFSFENYKVRLEVKNSNEFTVYLNDEKLQTPAILKSGKNFPVMLEVPQINYCKKVILFKMSTTEPFSGQYSAAVQRGSLCDLLIDKWPSYISSERDIAYALRSQYVPFLDSYDVDLADDAIPFSDKRIRDIFGNAVYEASDEEFLALEGQLKACILTAKQRPYLIAGGEFYDPKSIKLFREAFWKKGRLNLSDLIEKRNFAAFKNRRLDGPIQPREVIGDVSLFVGAQNPTLELGQNLASRVDELYVLLPSELDDALKSILSELSQAAIEKAGRNRETIDLTDRPFRVSMPKQNDTQYLLSSYLGHHTYMPTKGVNKNSCFTGLPVVVHISSLLPLDALTSERYVWKFFHESFFVAEQICKREFGVNFGGNLDVKYIFDERIVGRSLLQRTGERSAKAKYFDVKVKAVPHPDDNINYFYDKAFVKMLGPSVAVMPELPAVEQHELKALYQAGDLQAGLLLALTDADSEITLFTPLFGSSGTHSFSFNQKLMEEVADNGSVAAAYFLAIQQAKKTNLISFTPNQPIDFYELSMKDQNDILLWYAKAKVGGVYWTFYLEEVFENWNVKTANAINLIKSQGIYKANNELKLKSETKIEFSARRAAKAYNSLLMGECGPSNQFLKFFTGKGDVDLLLSSIALDEKVLGDACYSKIRMVEEGFTLRTSVRDLLDLECSGDSNEKNCGFKFRLNCSASSFYTYDSKHAESLRLQANLICMAVSNSLVEGTASFRLTTNGWIAVEGTRTIYR